MTGFDEEAIAHLKGSLQIVGQIYGVIRCKQHPDQILAGAHRLEGLRLLDIEARYVDMDIDKRAQELGYSHEITEQLIRIHSNTQRQVSKEERTAEFEELARRFEASGIKKEDVAQKVISVVKYEYSPQYVLQLLPEEWKHQEKVEAGKLGGEAAKASRAAMEEPHAPGRAREEMEQVEERPEPYSKGISPSPKEGLRSEYTPSQVSMMNGLHEAGIKYTSEVYQPVDKWRCPVCRSQFVKEELSPHHGKNQCLTPGCKGELERMKYRLDILVPTMWGFSATVEVEGGGSSSKDNKDREALLLNQDIRTVHVPNEMADRFPLETAALIRTFL